MRSWILLLKWANSLRFQVGFPTYQQSVQTSLDGACDVAKDERTFSRLKLIKTYLRTSMKEQRLESLMLISCEKDITNDIDIDTIAAKWV
jgi:hypothetical protein